MDNKELMLLEKICDVTDQIYSYYQILIALEKNGYKYINSYNEVLEYLAVTMEQEKELYEAYTPKSSFKAYNYLKIKINLDASIPTEFSTIDCDKSELCSLRIIQNLKNIFGQDEKIFVKDLDDEIKESIAKDDDSLAYVMQIMPKLEKEKELRLVDFISCQIKAPQNEFVKRELINTKYLICFLTPNLEKDLIPNKFEVKTHSFDEDLAVNMPNIDDEFIDDIKSSYGNQIIYSDLDELFEYKDQELTNSNAFLAINLLTQSISVGLLFFEDQEIEDILGYIHEQYPSNKKNQMISSFVERIFEQHEQKKAYANKDSFGKDKSNE